MDGDQAIMFKTNSRPVTKTTITINIDSVCSKEVKGLCWRELVGGGGGGWPSRHKDGFSCDEILHTQKSNVVAVVKVQRPLPPCDSFYKASNAAFQSARLIQLFTPRPPILHLPFIYPSTKTFLHAYRAQHTTQKQRNNI